MTIKKHNAKFSRRDILKTSIMAGASFAAATGFDLAGMARAFAGPLAGPLEISNWPYYIDKETIPNFEKKFGIDVKYVEDINDNAGLFGKIAGPLRNGRNPGRDIVVPTDYLVARLIKLGWLDKFTPADVPNIKNIDPSVAHASYDPQREFSLPWAGILTSVAYNIDKTGHELTSINDIFDPAFKGHVSMLTQMRDTLAPILLGMSIDPEKATYKDAEAAVQKIKDNVANGQIRQFFGNDYGPALARGDIWVAFGWSGDLVQLQKETPSLRFMTPKEGFFRENDNMVIPLKAPHRDAALAWMNYVYDPAVFAKITETIQYIPPVAGVQAEVKKVNPALAANPLVFPTPEMIAKTHGFVDLTAEEEHRWETLFQSAIGH